MTEADEKTFIPPASLFAEIQRVAENGATKADAHRLYDWIVEEHKNRTRLIVLGTLQERVSQFLNQAALVREVDKRLADEDRLARASNLELITLRRTLVGDMYKLLELILPKLGPLVGEEEPPQGLLTGHLHMHVHTGETDEKELPLSRVQQENLVRFFSAFSQHLSGGRQVAEIPAKVEEAKPVTTKAKKKKKKKKRGRGRKKNQ